MPTFRERFARWLYPSGFVQEAPVTRQQPDTAPKRLLDEATVPEHAPEPPEKREYDALVQLQWGHAQLAATAVKNRVRLMQSAGATPERIRREIAGTDVVIE